MTKSIVCFTLLLEQNEKIKKNFAFSLFFGLSNPAQPNGGFLIEVIMSKKLQFQIFWDLQFQNVITRSILTFIVSYYMIWNQQIKLYKIAKRKENCKNINPTFLIGRTLFLLLNPKFFISFLKDNKKFYYSFKLFISIKI